MGLPPSITLNPGFVYVGRPLGISYEIAAHIGPLTVQSGPAVVKSRVPLRIKKGSYYPLLREVVPKEIGEKTFLGSSKPLIMTASLDKQIYFPGQPIMVTSVFFSSSSPGFSVGPFLQILSFFFFFVRVDIKNQSSHDVSSIRISAKQIVTSRISGNDRESYKCQVALLESSRGCPIRKHSDWTYTYSIVPELMSQENYHVAQQGRLNMSDESRLAPTTRPDESPKDRRGLQVEYYVNVHAQVSFSPDLIVKVPFIMSGEERKEGWIAIFFFFFFLFICLCV